MLLHVCQNPSPKQSMNKSITGNSSCRQTEQTRSHNMLATSHRTYPTKDKMGMINKGITTFMPCAAISLWKKMHILTTSVDWQKEQCIIVQFISWVTHTVCTYIFVGQNKLCFHFLWFGRLSSNSLIPQISLQVRKNVKMDDERCQQYPLHHCCCCIG